MRKLFIVLSAALLTLSVAAQQKQKVAVSSWQEYDQKKSEGFIPIPSEGMRSTGHMEFSTNPERPSAPSALRGGDPPKDGDCDCYLPIDETYEVVPFAGYESPDYRNDDGSSGEIDLPFTFCLYGDEYNSCYINNNGNISFGAAYSTFSSNAFPDASFKMVGAFWADVDTRNEDSGLVYYKVTDHALYVMWDSVGYYSTAADKLNGFQLIITDGTDPILDEGSNVSFCYSDMQWTTGSASQGVDGFGGIAATVGANRGDGILFVQFGQFDAPGGDYDGPFNTTDGIDWLDGKNFVFNTCSDNSNIAPFAPSTGLCDTLVVCQGGSSFLQFLGPEQNQEVQVTYTVDVPDQLNVTSQVNQGSTNIYINGEDNATPGVYLVNITGTDNGNPSLSSTVSYYVEVTSDIVIPPVIEGPEGLCPNGSGTLTVDDIYDTYVWSTGSSTSSTSINQPGDYTVLVGVGICQTLADITIETLPVPQPLLTANDESLCPGQTTTLTVEDIYETYAWDGGSPGSQNTHAGGPGSHTVVVTNDQGCAGAGTLFIETLPNASPVITGETPICNNDETTLSTTQTFSSYEWDNNSSNDEATFSANVGTHFVNVVNADGCTGTASFVVNPFPSPQLFDDLVCGDLTHSFDNAQSPLNGTWQILPADPNYQGTVDPADEINTTMTVDGYGVYTVTYTDVCSNSDEAEITFLPLVDFEIEDIYVCYDDSVEYFATSDFPEFYDWMWSDGDPGFNNVVYPDSTYYVTATNACGTLTEDVVIYGKICTITIPNIFTPNGDGDNDYFEVKGLNNFRGSTLTIFNRWGNVVLEDADYRGTWSAIDNADGTYFYILGINYPTGMEYHEGNVTVLRK